jgi:hypothetical protein
MGRYAMPTVRDLSAESLLRWETAIVTLLASDKKIRDHKAQTQRHMLETIQAELERRKGTCQQQPSLRTLG